MWFAPRRDASGSVLTARGESLAAFDGRCIPGGCVAPPSNSAGILSRRALPAGRLARLGATPDFHHGLTGDEAAALLTSTDRFAVSQDQRHTVRGRVSYRFTPSAWVALAAS